MPIFCLGAASLFDCDDCFIEKLLKSAPAFLVLSVFPVALAELLPDVAVCGDDLIELLLFGADSSCLLVAFTEVLPKFASSFALVLPDLSVASLSGVADGVSGFCASFNCSTGFSPNSACCPGCNDAPLMFVSVFTCDTLDIRSDYDDRLASCKSKSCRLMNILTV